MGKTRTAAFAFSVWAAMFVIGCEVYTDPSCLPEPTQSASPQHSPSAVAKGDLRFISDFRHGCDLAMKDGKPILLFFTAEWCHFCHQMAHESFTDRQVVNLSEQFVCILVDADASPTLCQNYGVRGFPTIQFLSARGQPLRKMVGKRPCYELIDQMHAALQSSATVKTSTKPAGDKGQWAAKGSEWRTVSN